MQLSITMLTVPRHSKHYVHFVAEALLKDKIPFTLMVGNCDATYLDKYKGNDLVSVIAPTVEEYGLNISSGSIVPIADQPVRARAVWNYWRAMGTNIGRPTGTHRIVMEDDVQLSKGWLPYLDKIRSKIEEKETDYILSLYVPADDENSKVQYDWPNDARKRREIYAPYPLINFYGTQALFMPESIRAGLDEWLGGAVKNNDPDPYDYLVRRFIADRKLLLFYTVPILVQHVGHETTGLAGKAHKAKWFEPDVRKL